VCHAPQGLCGAGAAGAEQRRKEEALERKRMQEERRRCQRLLEAAFDGAAEEVIAVLEEVRSWQGTCQDER